MEIARGVDLAIMIASFVFSFVFGWMYFREHQRYYLFWALGCILFGARYPFFWQMVGQDAVSPFILSLSFSMIFVGFFLLNNGLWKYIGFKYIPWANILAAVVYMALLSMLFFEDAFSPRIYIGFAYLCGGCISAFTGIQFFLLPRSHGALYWRILGVFLICWFVQGIWVMVSFSRASAGPWFLVSTGFLFLVTMLHLMISRIEGISLDADRRRISLTSSGMRLGWFEIVPDEGRLAIASQTYRILGYDPYAFPETIEAWLAHMDEKGRERAKAVLRKIQGRRRPSSFTCEHKIRTRDGHYLWIVTKGYSIQTSALGKPIRYIGISFDLTEEKRMMEALEEKNRRISCEEEQKKAILDSIPDTMLYLDLGWRVLMANAAACRLFGCNLGDIREKSFQELMGPEQNISGLCAALVDEAGSDVMTEEIETLSGRFWRLRIRPVVGAAGEREGYVLVIEDRTEYRAQEEQRAQMEKMMAIGQIAGGLAHDLKNQMMVTLGNLALIEESMSSDSKAYEYIKRVENATKGTKELIDNLLAFARKRPIEYTRMDTHEVIESSVQLLQHSLSPNMSIQTFLHARRSQIRGDIYQMQNALFNLAINARDAMPDGGYLSIETQCAYVEETQVFQYSQRLEPGEYIRISISDTGSGMSEGTLKRIFEPFFTTKPSGKGTGLGLSMVFGTVQAHHGAINVFSQPGEGTIFDIYLPLIEAYEEEQYAEDSLAQYRLM